MGNTVVFTCTPNDQSMLMLIKDVKFVKFTPDNLIPSKIKSKECLFLISLEHEYMESNCASDPVSECQFRPIKGLILKTVDSVYQNIASIEMCKQLCISADFR